MQQFRPSSLWIARALLGAALTLLSLTLAACGSDRGVQRALDPGVQDGAASANADGPAVVSAPPAGLSLPDPHSLPLAAPRSGSFVDADVVKAGDAYDPALPNDRVIPDGSGSLTFDPVIGTDTGLPGAAYCIYHFTAPGYDRSPQVLFSRTTDPNFSRSWIGLVNWTTLRWDWYHDDPDEVLDLESIAPYFNGNGELYLAVMELGTAASDIEAIRLGSLGPQAKLIATPDHGTAPLHVELDASSSIKGAANFTNFEWDKDSDGIYEAETFNNPTYSFDFAAEGVYHVTVRVTNGLDLSDTDSVTITVDRYWQHTLGVVPDSELLVDCEAGAQGGAYLLGTGRASPDFRYAVNLYKLAANGSLEWARQYSVDSLSATPTSLARLPNGDLLVGGEVGDTDVFIQRWNSSGTLLWSKVINTPDGEQCAEVGGNDTNLYLGGRSTVAASGNVNYMVAQLDNSGVVLWSRVRDLGVDEICDCMEVKSAGSTQLGVILAGTTFDGFDHANDTIWEMEWDSSGSVIGGAQCQLSGTQGITHVYDMQYYRPSLADPAVYYFCGTCLSPQDRGFAFAIPSSGSSLWGQVLGTDISDLTALAVNQTGDLVCAGDVRVDSFLRALTCRFDGASGAVQGYKLGSQANENAALLGLSLNGDDMLVCGDASEPELTWTSALLTSSSTSATWASDAGSGSAPGYTTSDLGGNVSDITGSVTLDDDSADWNYAALRPQP